jgi:uncharacterized protein YgbK (DUF1537 family)
MSRQEGAVLAVDSGSRSATALQAVARVAELSAELAGCSVLFKTVDSTLRGHVKAELEACFKASGRKKLVFAPAFPAAGRTTVGGIQLVNGVPVSETVYGRDPVHPARSSALADLIPTCIENVMMLDAVSQEELNAQIAALPEPETILWVGSPGMASALALRFVPVANPTASVAPINGDVLVVIGSANPHSHRQADCIQQARGVTLIRSPSNREDNPASVLHRIAAKAAQDIRTLRFGALIATGGDTMQAILDRLDVREFEILQELDPGFPLGRATFDSGQELLLAMKAGGFGDDNVLQRAITKLREATPFSKKVSI